MFVGIQVVTENAPRLITQDRHVPNVITIIVSVVSGMIMLVYFMLIIDSLKTNSSSLRSAAKITYPIV